MAYTRENRGTINYDHYVHDGTGRGKATNWYGDSATLGKSSSRLYSDNFDHVNSIMKLTEYDLGHRFLNDRTNLANNAPSDSAINPDFAGGTVQYGYNNLAAGIQKIPFNGNEVSTLDAAGAIPPGLSSIPDISPSESTTAGDNKLEAGDAADLPGKYTGNLNTKGLDFNGNVDAQAREQYVLGASGGGFGHNNHIPFESRTNSGTTFADIHHNTTTGSASNIKNIRGDGVSNVTGLLGQTNSKRGTLGAYSWNYKNYDTTHTAQP